MRTFPLSSASGRSWTLCRTATRLGDVLAANRSYVQAFAEAAQFFSVAKHEPLADCTVSFAGRITVYR